MSRIFAVFIHTGGGFNWDTSWNVRTAISDIGWSAEFIPGLVYKPAGAVSLVLGGGAIAFDKAGKGALNVWGLFHVDDPVCPGYAVKPKGWIQTIRVTAPGYTNSKIEQGFTAGTFGGDTSQVKVCVKNYGNRTRHFNGDVKGVRPMSGTRCSAIARRLM